MRVADFKRVYGKPAGLHENLFITNWMRTAAPVMSRYATHSHEIRHWHSSPLTLPSHPPCDRRHRHPAAPSAIMTSDRNRQTCAHLPRWPVEVDQIFGFSVL